MFVCCVLCVCWHGSVAHPQVIQHPGGEEVLIDEGAKDATGPFEDVGHSPDARDLLEKYYIGDVDPAVSCKAKAGSNRM